MSARRIAGLQSYCPIPLYNAARQNVVYGHICNFRVEDARLRVVIRMVNDANTDILVDPTDTGYVQKLTSEFRSRKFRVHPKRVHFQVDGQVVSVDQFFCKTPFTKEYFEQCASLNDNERDVPLNPSRVTGIFSSINIGVPADEAEVEETPTELAVVNEAVLEQAPGTELAVVEEAVVEQVPGTELAVVEAAFEQEELAEVDEGVIEEALDLDLADMRITLAPCKDPSFQRLLMNNVHDLIVQRNKFIQEEPSRKDAIRREIDELKPWSGEERLNYMLNAACSCPRPQYLSCKQNGQACIPVEVRAIQRIVDKTSSLNLKVKHAKWFVSEPIEQAYIDTCENLPMATTVFEPNLMSCGTNNEFLMWRSSCPTEVQMRRMAWNRDKVRTSALQTMVRKEYLLASCTLTYGDKWCNMRPGHKMALLVRACVEKGMKVGEAYVIRDERLMIPAFLVIFE